MFTDKKEGRDHMALALFLSKPEKETKAI